MDHLKKQIETVRNELNQSILEDVYEVYYAKSVELDQLIEQYIALQEEASA